MLRVAAHLPIPAKLLTSAAGHAAADLAVPVGLQDFGTFYQSGITTWDAADHYGPAEVLIGRYLQEHPEQRQNVQVGA
jgi:hypothetical protein